MYSFFIKLFATCFFIGYIPILRGTLASILSVFIYFITPEGGPFYLLLFIFIILSIVISQEAEIIFGKKDDPRITIDEFSSFWIVMLFHKKEIYPVFLGFLFYRILDSIKPFYKKLQKLKGWKGIVMDDFISAVVSNLLLHFIKIIQVA